MTEKAKVSDFTFWDVATARLWISLRESMLVDRYYPLWDLSQLAVQPVRVFEIDPSAALLLALRSGRRIKALGMFANETEPRNVPDDHWPYAAFLPEATDDKLGASGLWQGMVFKAADIRRVFPNPLPRHFANGMVAAKLDLQAAVQKHLSFGGPIPLSGKWRAHAEDAYDLTAREAKAIWREVARDHPWLSEAKNKPKVRRAA